MLDSPDYAALSRRKGQAALEFLTTYGWAFLVILVAIGALAYFGVLNPSRSMPDKCLFGTVFTCTDSLIQAAPAPGQVSLTIMQNKGSTIFIQGMTINMQDFGTSGQCTAGGTALDGVNEVRVESNAKIEIVCPLQAAALSLADFEGDKESAQMRITYRELRSTFAHVEDGEMYSTVRP